MADVKRKARINLTLTQTVRDAEEAPEHIPSAGETLIKELVKKQTRTETSLTEQLAVKQTFVPGLGLDDELTGGLLKKEDVSRCSISSHHEGTVSNSQDALSIDDLMSRTGLSRDAIEAQLSVKPNSELSKLYRFALSNQAPTSSNLISQLPEHPLNNLKAIEEEFMKDVHCPKVKEFKVKKRKHKVRGKKKKVESVGPFFRDEYKEVKKDDVVVMNSAKGSRDDRRERPSLWDVRDMKRFCSGEKHGCPKQKLFAVKDGKIVEVTNEENTNLKV